MMVEARQSKWTADPVDTRAATESRHGAPHQSGGSQWRSWPSLPALDGNNSPVGQHRAYKPEYSLIGDESEVHEAVGGGGRIMPDGLSPPDTGRPLLSRVLASTDLLKGLTAAEVAELASVCEERYFASGEHILREGDHDPFLYILVDGRAQLSKSTSFGDDQILMGELGCGDVLGELKIVDPQPSSASVLAVTRVTAVAIDLDAFADLAALARARATVLGNIGKILAARLRARTGQGADAMERELDASRARAYAGRFIVLMFSMVATYQLALSALVLVPNTVRPPNSILSFIFVIWTVIPIVLSLRNNPFSLESYGLTMRRAGPIALQALIWTTPLVLLLFGLKLALMRWAPSMAHRPLFDPAALFDGRPFDLAFYLFAIFLYAIHAPLQEFVARAGIQGTLQHFIPGPSGCINWKAILISNLLFASAHCFLGLWFSLAVFVLGQFWGWMFAKQRSLIGVIVSHIVVGLCALFALGLQAFID
jgi:CRP-like cAMP-binding protein